MKIYQKGQYVTYNNMKWLIVGFGEDIDGHTKFYLRRGRHRVVADETEVSEE